MVLHYHIDNVNKLIDLSQNRVHSGMLIKTSHNLTLIIKDQRTRTVGSRIYTPIFSFLGKELSMSRFQSWNRSQMKGPVILYSIWILTNFKIHLFLKK